MIGKLVAPRFYPHRECTHPIKRIMKYFPKPTMGWPCISGNDTAGAERCTCIILWIEVYNTQIIQTLDMTLRSNVMSQNYKDSWGYHTRLQSLLLASYPGLTSHLGMKPHSCILLYGFTICNPPCLRCKSPSVFSSVLFSDCLSYLVVVNYSCTSVLYLDI